VPEPHVVHIGLGSNLGDRESTLRAALRVLDAEDDIEVLAASPFIETLPVGGPPQGPFLNAAAALATPLPPRVLLDRLHRVEQGFGRRRIARWGPRTLDLDILLCGDLIVAEADLRVPHPLMHVRRFVLEPLDHIAADAVHPVLRKTVRRLLRDLPEERP